MKVEIVCDECNKKYMIDCIYISEIFGIKCPKCNSDKTWITEIIDGNNNEEITLGRGGCSQK